MSLDITKSIAESVRLCQGSGGDFYGANITACCSYTAAPISLRKCQIGSEAPCESQRAVRRRGQEPVYLCTYGPKQQGEKAAQTDNEQQGIEKLVNQNQQ